MTNLPILQIPDSKPIRFSDLADMLASAMWPDNGKDDLRIHYGARLNLEGELKKAAEDGALSVRNASTLSRETFFAGAALGSCVVLFHDLAAYFTKRGGYELRPAPYGQGPEFWTIEGAAAAIADQEMWHIGAREALQARMVDAAAQGALVVRDPQTDLPYAPATTREYYDLVTPADVNSWLSISGVGYRWRAGKWDNQAESPGGGDDFSSGFWEATLGASVWWGYADVSTEEAAKLLCGLPGDADDAEAMACADFDFRRIARTFKDVARDGKARRLRDWLKVVRDLKLAHHPWIDEWDKSHPDQLPKTGEPAVKPVPRAVAHEQNILRVLRDQSFDPKRLPKAPAGKASQAKQSAKTALPNMSKAVFDDAWQRLRDAGEISDG